VGKAAGLDRQVHGVVRLFIVERLTMSPDRADTCLRSGKS
jgi:hypothetical protein